VDWRDKGCRQNFGEGTPVENSLLEDRCGYIDILIARVYVCIHTKVLKLVHLFVRHLEWLGT
jgi:hypothetical protein